MFSSFAFYAAEGALTGIIFGLGALLIYMLPKYKWLGASVLITLITPLALLPFWNSYGNLGISDWDYYLSMHTNLRNAIIQHHQFPLWNPYTCGGTSALGDPEFPVLSPLFLFELAFGTPLGLILSIYASTAIGGLGMLHLSRKLGIGPIAGLASSLAMAFGTVNLLEIVEGHQNILAAMYIPWVLYFWYQAYTSQKRARWLSIIGAASCMSLMFFQGGIYLLMYMTGTFLFMLLVAKRKTQALAITASAGVLALGLAAVKVIPVAYWLSEFSDKVYASSTYTIFSLDKILLGRILYGAENVIPNQGGGWHEYAAYIGPVILTLSICGVMFYWKHRIVRLLLISACIATLISSTGPLLKPAFDHLSFIPRSNISRVILLAVIPISLLAGFGTQGIEKRSKKMGILAIVLVTLAAIDLMSLSYPISSQAFVLPHVNQDIPPAPFPIAYSPYDYKTRYNGVDYTRAYDATLQGYGNMTYCSVLGPDPSVDVITDEGRGGILSLSGDKEGTFTIKSWTPNGAVFLVHATKETSAILNANYAIGWFVNGSPAKEMRNRPGINIPAGDTTLRFSYIPRGMMFGIGISIVTLLGVLLSLFSKENTSLIGINIFKRRS